MLQSALMWGGDSGDAVDDHRLSACQKILDLVEVPVVSLSLMFVFRSLFVLQVITVTGMSVSLRAMVLPVTTVPVPACNKFVLYMFRF